MDGGIFSESDSALIRSNYDMNART